MEEDGCVVFLQLNETISPRWQKKSLSEFLIPKGFFYPQIPPYFNTSISCMICSVSCR